MAICLIHVRRATVDVCNRHVTWFTGMNILTISFYSPLPTNDFKIIAKSSLYCAVRQAVFGHCFSHLPSWLMHLYVSVHNERCVCESYANLNLRGNLLKTANFIETKQSSTKAVHIFSCPICLLQCMLVAFYFRLKSVDNHNHLTPVLQAPFLLYLARW